MVHKNYLNRAKLSSQCMLAGLFFLFLNYPSFCFAQPVDQQRYSLDYSYVHYDINDGLAGSTAYCMTQDKDGFLWIGTETGLSRFDGTHFVTYTTADGLPDIEILQLFGDSKGRVWMAPFKQSACYYYKGKIYNQNNDTLLKKIRFQSYIENFAEDKAGNILLQENEALHLVCTNGEVREFTTIDGQPIKQCIAICRSANGHFLVLESGKLYELADGRFTLFKALKYSGFPMGFGPYVAVNERYIATRIELFKWSIISLTTGEQRIYPCRRYHYKHNTYCITPDSLLYLNETNGCTEYNMRSGTTKHYMPGIDVSRTYRDREGNTWFTTLGHGIYRLTSEEFRTLSFTSPEGEKCGVFAMYKWGNQLYLGGNYNTGARFTLPQFTDPKFTDPFYSGRSIIAYIDQKDNDHLFLAGDNICIFYKPDLTMDSLMGAYLYAKAGCRKNDKELLISGSRGLMVVDRNSMVSTDTLLTGRVNAVFYRNDSIYAATLNGLCLIKNDKSITNLGDQIPFLKKRIASIVSTADGTIWVASLDAGVMGFRNEKVVAILGLQQGLTSEICRTLAVQDHFLWVGTNKGLNKVDLAKPGYPITHYTVEDGMASNIINTIFVDSSSNRLYVGTPLGVSIFSESGIQGNSNCNLLLLDLINGGRHRLGDSSALKIPYNKSDLRIEYAGISYRSGHDIAYRYRLIGLDSNWQMTRESFLSYPTLPSGKYQLQLVAINKFGIQSQPLILNFTVTTAFWRTLWFEGLMILVISMFIWMIFAARARRVRKRQEEKDQLKKKMSEVEHMALQAQMNPHFIFNCLNSIQQFIFNQDVYSANKYITEFAKLIRSTLQYSSRPQITLREEIGYLSSYLSLEQMRFKERMDYTIEVSPSLNIDDLEIPPMLIQPYVENSMRHGIRHKSTGKGQIRISITAMGNDLVFKIEDNGIGRKEAQQFKTAQHIEYQSKGMSLTADRIRLIHSVYGNNIRTEIIDLEDEAARPTGTKVIVTFINLLNEEAAAAWDDPSA